MALDARGAEITVGDTVIYFKTGRYAEKMTAIVKEVGPTIKIEAIDQLTRLYNRAGRENARVKGTSLIVVESLPAVEGRLNTSVRAQLPLPTPSCGEIPEDLEPLEPEEFQRRLKIVYTARGIPVPESAAGEYERTHARYRPAALRSATEEAVRQFNSSRRDYENFMERLPAIDFLSGYTDHLPGTGAGDA